MQAVDGCNFALALSQESYLATGKKIACVETVGIHMNVITAGYQENQNHLEYP